MVSGLREKILASLLELGISSGEVLTTDTHIVNAVVMNERGYHPVGEAIDHQKLIEDINKAAVKALGNLEPAKASWRQEVIQDIKVIGEQHIDKLSLIVDEGAKRAKKTSTLIFPAIGLILAILLFLL
jgi:predicted neutral ceramidase superfamily lipid hydrolase